MELIRSRPEEDPANHQEGQPHKFNLPDCNFEAPMFTSAHADQLHNCSLYLWRQTQQSKYEIRSRL